jgi:N-acyl-D-amino-acid deacylase
MTLLIKNVRVIGGKTTFPEPVDVFIAGDKISAIGSFPDKKADSVVDGQGNYLSPGFIDVNTDSDHYLSIFDDPGQEDFLRQGVTTIIGGLCGSSLAPLLYGSLESIQKWGDVSAININWRSLGEFLNALEQRRLGVNFGTLVGHSTIRRGIAGDVLRDLTKNELAVFNNALTRSLKEGGFGLSTGLEYIHSRNTPYGELKLLAQTVKKFNGVYSTHLRKPKGGIAESVKETIRLAKETGVATIISHFMPISGSETEYKSALQTIAELPRGMDFYFDVYPYDASMIALYTLLPRWAQCGDLKVMVENVKDQWFGARLTKEFPDITPDCLTVARAPGNEVFVGKTIGDLCETFGVTDRRNALLELMRATGLKATVFYKNIDAALINHAITHQRSLIATNAASFSPEESRLIKAERAIATFTKFLGIAAREKVMPLEAAIDKITSVPAGILNLAGRGKIAEGNIADLVIFRVRENIEPPGNIEIQSVIVNGAVAVKDGKITNKLAGKILRHRQ